MPKEILEDVFEQDLTCLQKLTLRRSFVLKDFFQWTPMLNLNPSLWALPNFLDNSKHILESKGNKVVSKEGLANTFIGWIEFERILIKIAFLYFLCINIHSYCCLTLPIRIRTNLNQSMLRCFFLK